MLHHPLLTRELDFGIIGDVAGFEEDFESLSFVFLRFQLAFEVVEMGREIGEILLRLRVTVGRG